jgi:hypothetical protein
LVNFAAAQHNASVSSNFCKELDLARFYQRAFFCPDFCSKDGIDLEIKLLQRSTGDTIKTTSMPDAGPGPGAQTLLPEVAVHFERHLTWEPMTC